MAAAELAKGVVYEHPIITGSVDLVSFIDVPRDEYTGRSPVKQML